MVCHVGAEHDLHDGAAYKTVLLVGQVLEDVVLAAAQDAERQRDVHVLVHAVVIVHERHLRIAVDEELVGQPCRPTQPRQFTQTREGSYQPLASARGPTTGCRHCCDSGTRK